MPVRIQLHRYMPQKPRGGQRTRFRSWFFLSITDSWNQIQVTRFVATEPSPQLGGRDLEPRASDTLGKSEHTHWTTQEPLAFHVSSNIKVPVLYLQCLPKHPTLEQQSHTYLPACPWGRQHSRTPTLWAVLGLITRSWNTGLPKAWLSLAQGWLRTTNRSPWCRREITNQTIRRIFGGGDKTKAEGIFTRLFNMRDITTGFPLSVQQLLRDLHSGPLDPRPVLSSWSSWLSFLTLAIARAIHLRKGWHREGGHRDIGAFKLEVTH